MRFWHLVQQIWDLRARQLFIYICHLKIQSNPWNTRSASSVSRVSPTLRPTPAFVLTCMHAAGGPWRGGLDQQFILWLHRGQHTTCPSPDPLFRSPALICLNEPGLILSQKCRPAIWTSKRGNGRHGILLLIHFRSRPAAQQTSLTNVSWSDQQDFISNKERLYKEVRMLRLSL